MTGDEITAAQMRLRLRAVTPRNRGDYLRHARWWRLEARRGYPSSHKSLEYAQNMIWAAEWAGLTGPGTWLELKERAARRQ